MATHADTCPLSQQQLVDEFFMEHRAQILAIAAFLDRLERSRDQNARDDFRVVAFKKAIQVLLSDESERARRAQMVLSDLNTDLLDVRDGQSAFGAPNREVEQ